MRTALCVRFTRSAVAIDGHRLLAATATVVRSGHRAPCHLVKRQRTRGSALVERDISDACDPVRILRSNRSGLNLMFGQTEMPHHGLRSVTAKGTAARPAFNGHRPHREGGLRFGVIIQQGHNR